MLKAVLAFVAGTIGIVMGAGPFIHSMQGFSLEIGISAIILAVIISPIAGEMPEKISMMILARKGAAGASIAIANVLGSKILNNTLLLAVAVFGAMFHAGFYTTIELTTVLLYQVILVTVVTIIALVTLFKREIGLKAGILLASMYLDKPIHTVFASAGSRPTLAAVALRLNLFHGNNGLNFSQNSCQIVLVLKKLLEGLW